MFDSRIVPVLFSAPDDVSGLEKMIDGGEIAARDIKGLNITHEGDGYSRGFTQLAFANMLARKLGTSTEEVMRTVPMQAIAGTVGFMVPHVAVFVRREVDGKEGQQKRLVVAGANTREILPEETGTMVHVREVAKTVRELVKDAQISDPKDVHFVFVKGTWPFADERAAAERRGKKVVSNNDTAVGEFSRGACALGVAVALGEVAESNLNDGTIMKNRDKFYSNVAHVSSGNERKTCAVILAGNTTKSVSNSIIGHGVLDDGLDADGVKRILKEMGFTFDCCPSKKDQARIEYAFLKPKNSELPTIRGYRHTLMTDTMIGPWWWLVEKTAPHGVVASVLGTPLFEVATGVEHQGPPGRPLLAIIARAA